MELLLCHTQAFQLAWLAGQPSFPVLFSTVHTDIKPQPQRGSVLFTDLDKTGMTKAVFARMRKAQAKRLICIANNKKMVNSLLKYYDSLNVLNNHQKKKGGFVSDR